MLIIGLCGGSGSGKGTVGRLFQGFGYRSIDTDKLYRKLITPGGDCIPELVEEFGFGIMLADGSVNRRALAREVFESEDSQRKKQRLDEITHKHILNKARQKIALFESEGVKVVFVDAPLLFESGFDKECDYTLGIIADENIRISRIMERDDISEEKAIKRIKSQLKNDILIQKCDFIIENNGTEEELSEKVSLLAEKLLTLEKRK